MLSVFPSVKWGSQAVCKCSGRSRLAFSPGVDQKNPSFDPSPCISSTWPVTWQVMPDVILLPGAASLVLGLLLSKSSAQCPRAVAWVCSLACRVWDADQKRQGPCPLEQGLQKEGPRAVLGRDWNSLLFNTPPPGSSITFQAKLGSIRMEGDFCLPPPPPTSIQGPSTGRSGQEAHSLRALSWLYTPHPHPNACLLWLSRPSTHRANPAHLLHQHFLMAHLIFTLDAPRPARCLCPAVNTQLLE